MILFGGDPEVHELVNDYAKIEVEDAELLSNC